ncbi:GNAT family N-acetyltransferase [Cryptosporangium phraense]|uniref:GNAT family N-acetyltransferase n=1 Tax=Cryptosporangium phraense TaxID=2593070 RepID=A0A545AE71_9ACTN|nr:GNAT family protein [Cryptosporangium phraense]TQS39624.1 GNAT family N-acetyltransferase [Cryptosporangium phraense]
MEPAIRLRPVGEDDLGWFRLLRTDADFCGLDWKGFSDPGEPARRFAENGFLGEKVSWLVVETVADEEAVALVQWHPAPFAGNGHWEIGIVVFPERRGQGFGWRAQALLCDYLFAHTPVQRIQAGTHPENVAEQKALVRAGFQLEGVIRSCDFRGGAWHDGLLYSRLRTDPAPDPT